MFLSRPVLCAPVAIFHLHEAPLRHTSTFYVMYFLAPTRWSPGGGGEDAEPSDSYVCVLIA